MGNITDVFFDLDHTLWDFEKNSALAFETLFAEMNLEVDLPVFLESYIPINFDYWERYRRDEITHEELRYGRFSHTFNTIGVKIPDAVIQELSEGYIRHLPTNNHLLEGAREILDYLSPRYRLHIITNGFSEVQKRKLENSDILKYFETVTNSENAGVKKPNPGIFEHALKVANASCGKSIMIGDCIEADVRGALNCGIDAIWMTSGAASHDGIKQINQLSELKKYL